MSAHADRVERWRGGGGSVDALIAAGAAIERRALGHGLAPLEAIRFRFAVEEFCSERLSRAFDTNDQAQAHITLELRPGEFVVVIEDSGSPIGETDAAAGARGWLAQLLSRGFADRLHASYEVAGRAVERDKTAIGSDFRRFGFKGIAVGRVGKIFL